MQENRLVLRRTDAVLPARARIRKIISLKSIGRMVSADTADTAAETAAVQIAELSERAQKLEAGRKAAPVRTAEIPETAEMPEIPWQRNKAYGPASAGPVLPMQDQYTAA